MQKKIAEAAVAANDAVRPGQAIAVIDLGGQYCHMIGRRLRDLGVRADIFGHRVSSEELGDYAGIILSGGPQSVYHGHAPTIDRKILKLGRPILGICYGHQLLAKLLRSKVAPSGQEFGKSLLKVQCRSNPLFKSTPVSQTVWMSHGDSVRRLGENLIPLAKTDACEIAAFADKDYRLFGVQFHPEVAHTKYGRTVLENFSRSICKIDVQETIADRVSRLEDQIRQRAQGKSVFFFVSGGVDSTVAFALCAKALGRDKVLGAYVDTGLMRKNETKELRSLLHALDLDDRLIILSESERFLDALKDAVDPEEKRKTIGRLFIEIQNDAIVKFGIEGEHWLLGQGTIYPDTIESGGSSGTTALIKTHHNRCDEIRALMASGKVIEPLVEFYKDEVREIGQELGVPQGLTGRWPFPGPGLAIRCLCVDGSPRSARSVKLPRKFSSYKAAEIPLQSVGVQGDARTYRRLAAISGPLTYPTLEEISSEICNTNATYNRVIALIAGDQNRLADAKVVPARMDRKRLELLREADNIMRTIMEAHDLTNKVWQFPVVLIPLALNGGESVVLRPVNSQDGMTANFGRLPVRVLKEIAAEIRKLQGIDAVFLDISDKPPATIEWE